MDNPKEDLTLLLGSSMQMKFLITLLLVVLFEHLLPLPPKKSYFNVIGMQIVISSYRS